MAKLEDFEKKRLPNRRTIMIKRAFTKQNLFCL